MICGDDTLDRIRIIYMYNGKYTQFFFAPLPDLLRLSHNAQVPEAIVDGVDSLLRTFRSVGNSAVCCFFILRFATADLLVDLQL